MAFFLPFSFFLSSLPSLTSSAHHSPLFIFVRECIWQGGRPAFISQDIPACISESEEIYYILVRMATRGTFSFQLLSRGAAGRLRCCDAALRWEWAVLRDENKEKCGKKNPIFDKYFELVNCRDTVTYHDYCFLFVMWPFCLCSRSWRGTPLLLGSHTFLLAFWARLWFETTPLRYRLSKAMMRDDERCGWRGSGKKDGGKIRDKDPAMQKIVRELSKVLILLSPRTKARSSIPVNTI